MLPRKISITPLYTHTLHRCRCLVPHNSPPLASSFDSRIDPEPETRKDLRIGVTWSTKIGVEPQQGGNVVVGVIVVGGRASRWIAET